MVAACHMLCIIVLCHVEIRNAEITLFRLVQGHGNVLVDTASFPEPLLVAFPGELSCGLAVRLPLVGPDGVVWACRIHMELRMPVIIIAVKTQTEAAYSGEQFSYSYFGRQVVTSFSNT